MRLRGGLPGVLVLPLCLRGRGDCPGSDLRAAPCAIREIPMSTRDDGAADDDCDSTTSDDRRTLLAPLEINARRQQAVWGPGRKTFVGSVGRRRIKAALAVVVGSILCAASALWMARENDYSTAMDAADGGGGENGRPTTTEAEAGGGGEMDSRGTDDGPHPPSSRAKDGGYDDGAREADDEPNPPPLPGSMRLFHPPADEAGARAMEREIRDAASDPLLTWEEFAGGDDDGGGGASRRRRPEGAPDATHTTAHHFSSRRIALLFAPGSYPIDFEVGYYASVLGLGARPDDVAFEGCERGPHVPALEKFENRPPWGSGLDTFWRSVENVSHRARGGMAWVVSQAAPLRRVLVEGDLNLHEGDAWVSGGVLANVAVGGATNFGGQQQFLARNCDLGGGVAGGAWSLVFVGCAGDVPRASDGTSREGGGPSVSVADGPGVRVEKPYVTMKAMPRGQYELELRVPAPAFGGDDGAAAGTRFEDRPGGGIVRDFRRVKLGAPSDSADSKEAAIQNHDNLQKALDEGKDLVLSPGIYPLSESLDIKHDNQVVLGLGYATLVAPEDGSPCVRVRPGVPGVRVAGVMLEASRRREGTGQGSAPPPPSSLSLLQWGAPGVDDPGDASNPGALSDVYARVGGVHRDVSADAMVRLDSGNVYGDNLWLWRADHVRLRPGEEPNFPHISRKYRQTVRGECEVKNGLVVGEGASNVTIVGLAVEHTTEDQTVWNGENGKVYFYQSELPYDVDHSYADNNFVGYRVGPNVKNHEAVGLGVYSNFRDHDVEVETAVVHPTNNGGRIHMSNVFTVKLDNMGKINSIVNGRGPGPAMGSERGRPYRCSEETCSVPATLEADRP